MKIKNIKWMVLGVFMVLGLVTGKLQAQNEASEVRAFFEEINLGIRLDEAFQELRALTTKDERFTFESRGVSYDNMQYVKEYHQFLDETFKVLKEHANNQLVISYAAKGSDTIAKYSKWHKQGMNIKELMEKTGLKLALAMRMKESRAYLWKDINLFLKGLKASETPLKLKLYVKGQRIDPSHIEIALILNTTNPEARDILILNSETSEIEVPDDFDFTSIVSLTVMYKGHPYTFEKYKAGLSKEVQEITSPLAQFCFEKLDYWTLSINATSVVLETRGIMSIHEQ